MLYYLFVEVSYVLNNLVKAFSWSVFFSSNH